MFVELLDQPWQGVMEICGHPGYFTPFGLPLESYNMEREYELRALTDPRLEREMARRGIERMNFNWMSAHYPPLTVEAPQRANHGGLPDGVG